MNTGLSSNNKEVKHKLELKEGEEVDFFIVREKKLHPKLSLFLKFDVYLELSWRKKNTIRTIPTEKCYE